MEINVPDLGVESAEVSEIMVKVGDVIDIDDNIVLLESDKASVEVPATQAGKITAINVKVGDSVKQGDVILTVEATQASAAPSETASSPQSAQAPEAKTETAAKTETQAQPIASFNSTQNTAMGASEQTYPLPDLGVESAEISEWLVNIGDEVVAEQPLVLVESDKASVEVPAPATGKIVEFLVNAGETVSNGQNFVVIEVEGQNQATPATAKASSQTQSQTQLQNTPLPTDVSTPAPQITAVQSPAATKSTQPSSNLSEGQINAKHANVYAGPAVRKLTRQLGVDISEVKGSGSHGRIVKEDIFAYVKNRMQALPIQTEQISSSTGSVRSGLPNLPDMSNTEIWGEIETQDLSRLQKVSIPQLNYSTYLPQVTQFDLADITDTEAMRTDIKEEMKKQGISLTILAFIMKAVAYAIGEYPKFNSHLSDDNTQIIIRKSVHMGFAVATPTGLTVPVIKDVQTKGIKQLAKEIGELAAKARDNKLTPKELTGASFTISSQGNLGGTYFTPLVTWPQVAILGVSEASMQPRWNEKTQSFEPRLMLPLSLSYDHRVINGADAAVFTRYIAKLLQDPRRILL